MENRIIIYDYESRNNVLYNGYKDALNAIYKVSFPQYTETFKEICQQLTDEKKKEGGGSNWRKTYCDGKYQWPIDFFYIPKDVLMGIWESYKTAYQAENLWNEYIGMLNDFLFIKAGLKEVYGTTEYSKTPMRHSIDQKMLKDVISENLKDFVGEKINKKATDDICEKVKELIEDYQCTYKFGSTDAMQFAGAFLSTPTTDRETVVNAWKDAFNIDVVIPDDEQWKDYYETPDCELNNAYGAVYDITNDDESHEKVDASDTLVAHSITPEMLTYHSKPLKVTL